MMRWGIVPWFAKTEDEFKALSTINAKSDRLLDSKMWREPFAKSRCLVPASGLYPRDYDRWLGIDDRGGDPRPLLELLHPYDAARMKMTPANPAVEGCSVSYGLYVQKFTDPRKRV